MLEKINGIDLCGVNINTQRRSFNMETMFFCFPRGKNKSRKIQEKVVWTIYGAILFMQQ
jgi:hypothetical protein